MYVRKRPCTCDACLDDDWDNCSNSEYTGQFELRKLKDKGMRVPSTRYNAVRRRVPENFKVF